MEDHCSPEPDSTSKISELEHSDPAALCVRHGTPVQRNVIQVSTQRYSFFSGCADCERETADRERRQEQRQFELAQEQAGVPERFRAATLSRFPIEAPGQAAVLEHAMAFVERKGKGISGFILVGGIGSGKTHVACAILNAFLQRQQSGRYCATVQELLRPIKESRRHKSEISERQALRSLCTPSLLVVDEVGLHELDEKDCALLTEIVNDRYGRKVPTIFISNLTVELLIRIVGDRVIDRFRDGGKTLVFDWPSLRTQIRESA